MGLSEWGLNSCIFGSVLKELKNETAGYLDRKSIKRSKQV